MSDQNVTLSNILFGFSLPYLSKIERNSIEEAVYFSANPTKRKLTEKIRQTLEAQDGETPKSALVLCKGVGIYPEFLLTESELFQIHRISSLVLRDNPRWLEEDTKGMTLEEKEFLADNYGFYRSYFNHSEAKELAECTLLLEGGGDLKMSLTPPSSVMNSRSRLDRGQVTGGFRFTVGGGEKAKDRLKSAHRKIISRRNRSGTASRLSTIRQSLQRRDALRKATDWHSSNPVSPRFHRALGQHLHRSSGMYNESRECASRLKHYRMNEASLRLFSDGRRYEEGEVLFYMMPQIGVFESEIKNGSTHVLKHGIHSVIYHKQGKDSYLKEGTQIRVSSVTLAKEWEGNFPDSPIGQYIIEAEVLDGDYKGSYLEFDGSELSYALELNEKVYLLSVKDGEFKKLYENISAEKNSYVPHGGLFIQKKNGKITEMVISSFDAVLAEEAVGQIVRFLPKNSTTPDTNIRVYNDVENIVSLHECAITSMQLSGETIGKELPSIYLFEEEDPVQLAMRQGYEQKRKNRRDQFKRDALNLSKETTNDKADKKEKLKNQYIKDMEAVKADEKRDLERKKKDQAEKAKK